MCAAIVVFAFSLSLMIKQAEKMISEDEDQTTPEGETKDKLISGKAE